MGSAQRAVVVAGESAHVLTGPQGSVADWRNNQIPDEDVDRCQCLLDTASVGAVGNV